ncbi:MAG: hypothetical protein IJU21_00300 [Bacteroidales bacterium]|nr:hypothetical protein [Bacteroidales bacterium]
MNLLPISAILKIRITTRQFNYWCSLCLGVTVLLRDILFPPPITYGLVACYVKGTQE